MSEAARKLLEQALQLSAEERSLLAQQLLESVAAANDAMEPEELAALDAALEETYADEEAGRVRDLFEAFPQLRSDS